MRKIIVITATVVWNILYSSAQPSFRDKSLCPEERAEDLIKQLTLEEKVSLMMNSSKPVERFGIKEYNWWNEALHGVARNGYATVFPQTIGMAASFNEDLLFNVFNAVSDEARVKNRISREQGKYGKYKGLTMWTPNINIFRDPRWGRGQETYGEDPYLTSIMGVSVIKGLQGNNINGIDKLHACAKHYAVHSGPEWNRHSYNAENISKRDLWETYLPAFEDAVKKGNVKEVMCAYNRFEGEPCCASNQLLIDILRNQWGFDGIILSDCGAIDNFYQKGKHETHQDAASASADAILNGTDLECGSAYNSIVEAVQKGFISEEELNISLKRVLKARFELGEMDGESPWDNLADSIVNCKKHKELALEIAQESIVLLKNNGILPLKSVKKIAVLGPNADNAEMQWGNYHGIAKNTITLLDAVKLQYPEADVYYNKLCDHTSITESIFSECSFNGNSGIMASYWHDSTMTKELISKKAITQTINFGKRDTIENGTPLFGYFAKLETTFSTNKTEDITFLFTTGVPIKLFINGKEQKLKKIPKALKVFVLKAQANKEYKIEIHRNHYKQSGFSFEMFRDIKPDYEELQKHIKDADIVLFAGGISAELEKEDNSVYAPGFLGGDRTDIELPKVQRDIIATLKKSGQKVVLINFSGSAIALEPEHNTCDAILQAWYPGEQGGQAIVDVLSGRYNPSGRLPITFYRNVNQLPDFEDYNMKNRTYRYMSDSPLYPFGYGLSFTTFNYENPVINKNEITKGEHVDVKIEVTNSGHQDGDEVVQVYLKKLDDPDGPIKTLRAFKRVTIPAGVTKEIQFELKPENLEWWNENTNSMEMVSGDYIIKMGGSSLDKNLTEVKLRIN